MDCRDGEITFTVRSKTKHETNIYIELLERQNGIFHTHPAPNNYGSG
jgi:hypothetical protein